MAQGDHQRSMWNLTRLNLEVGAPSTHRCLPVRSHPAMCVLRETDRFPLGRILHRDVQFNNGRHPPPDPECSLPLPNLPSHALT